MLQKSLKIFRDDRKYTAIVLFILFLIVLSGLISPVIIENRKAKWGEELTEKINEIKKSSLETYRAKEQILLNAKNNFRRQLVNVLTPGSPSYGSLIRLVNESEFANFSVEVFTPNGRLIAWNEIIALRPDELFPLEFPYGETWFNRNKLITYLTVLDTIHLEGDLFYFSISYPVEKHYSIQNSWFNELSLTRELSDKFLTDFEIDYNTYTGPTKDGRKYSFEILNNKNNKIGLVTFIKPAPDINIKTIYSDISKFQSILVVIGFIFLAVALRKDFLKVKYLSYRLLLIILYCATFRMILYYLNFPSNILSGSLVNPAYFSSAFGGGIVKSPVEFFITIIFVLAISLIAFHYLLNFIQSEKIKKYKQMRYFLILLLPMAFLFFMTLRGLAAAIRSVIFDSTLRYFKDPTLIPDLPSIVMNFNVLMLGTSVILIMCAYVILVMSLLPKAAAGKGKKNLLIVFILFQVIGVLFIILQKQPLISLLLSAVFVSFVFALIYHICFLKVNSIFNYVYSALCASIITIALLNYFNLDLEREALKTTAIELNRPNDNLLRFMVNETITNATGDERLIRIFSRQNHNYNATAFRIWSQSSLQRESLNSSVMIYDRSLQPLGSFEIGVPVNFNPAHYLTLPEGNEPEISEIQFEENKKYFSGIMPIADSEKVLGFIAATADADVQGLISPEMPEFLESKKNVLSSVLDIKQLKIFEFSDSKLTEVSGDIYPSRDQVKPLLNLRFSDYNEAWTNLNLNNEKYITYVLRTDENGSERITAVALKEKHFTWNLYNFFKIFIIHSIFIFLLFLILFILNFNKLKYSFRIQLLIAFLVISIIPVIILAAYNRLIVSDRSNTEIFSELNERTGYLQNHVQKQISKSPDYDLETIFKNAASELGISFAVYEGTEQIYTSDPQYYDAGLFERKLNPQAYYNLSYLSLREYVTSEKVENYVYSALYKKIDIADRNFIIEVNDALNKVQVTFSVLDADVFLFGVYSFAVIIIIIISTILANKISAPIRRLTKATDSVAHGDLNVNVENNEKGELRDLLEGFNLMTRELKRSESELAELERESAWKEMAKQVAHEIKNPLTPMKLAIQQLIAAYKDNNNKFNDMFEKLSATILNQIDNLSLIASEFSRFAKMPNLNIEKIDLPPVINDTVNLFLDEKIKIDVSSEVNQAIVEADKSQLRRMIINFIRNSIQAEATKIKFNIASQDGNYLITIKDNGKGIPSEVRHKIFESNFTTKEKGMGIGLKLAKRFLESINGSIELIDSSEEGTAFRISIPAHLQ